jgi:hypothetical protein
VSLAGVLADADGLGLIVDLATRALHRAPTNLYADYHHYLFHGAFGALTTAIVLTSFAHHRTRVFLFCLLTFHLHLLFDFVGSRGPSPEDLWPIYYFGPFSKNPMWLWAGQWALNAWQNYVITAALFAWAMALAFKRGDSFVAVFSRWADAIFLKVTRGWCESLVRAVKRH